MAKFANIIGELLDNAERHSDPETKDGSWSVAAFMTRRQEDGRNTHRCYMAFLSEGASIAESLRTAAPSVRKDIDEFCDRHARAGQSRETLATLIALQDTITRDAVATGQGRGGVGFQDVLEFVTTLGGTNVPENAPRVTIVSGKSCVRLRAPHIVGRRTGADQPRVLWCNTSNTAGEPPDANFVFDLEDRFAGTIVGLSFVIDRDFLEAAIDAQNQSERAD
jgi:hypothetical protein